MKVNIFGKNIEVTDRIREQVEKKMAKFDKYLDEETKVDVTLREVKKEQKVEVTVFLKNHILRTEEASQDLFASIDMAQESIMQQLVRYKSKLIDKKRTAREIFEEDYLEDYDFEEPIEIVKNKSFRIEPMDADEACEQMDMLRHSFYVFLNDKTNEVNVVYKRMDGKYGLIEPKI